MPMKRLFAFCLSMLALASCLPLTSDMIEVTSSSTINVAALGGYENIDYTLNTEVEGAVVEVRCNESWIRDIEDYGGQVSFFVDPNATIDERRATITLAYGGDEVAVTVIQAGLNINIEEAGNSVIRYTTNDGKIAGPVPTAEDAGDYYAEYGAMLMANVYTEQGGMMIFSDPVTRIAANMFEDCTNLVTIEIPESVEWIGTNAFLCCYNLAEVVLNDGLVGIDAFAFQWCKSLKSLYIPESVEEFGLNIVLRCIGLEEFQGPYASEDGRALIKDNVLYAAALAGITDYTIPSGVRKIGDFALYGFDELTSVTIAASVKEIGDTAFGDCNKLESFSGKFAADGGRALIDGTTFIALASAGLTSYTIPAGITEIAEGACNYSANITEVRLPKGLKTIGDSAFQGFLGTSIEIPNTVTYIGWQAFAYSSLESLTLPESVETIDGLAFESNWVLKNIYCEGLIPANIGEDSFRDGHKDRKIHVPAEALEEYRINWSPYADEIVAM